MSTHLSLLRSKEEVEFHFTDLYIGIILLIIIDSIPLYRDISILLSVW